MKKSSLLLLISGVVLFITIGGLLSYKFAIPLMGRLFDSAFDRSLSFPEKSTPSYDGKYELRQYSKKDKNNVNSLYFYITKANDKTPLFISNCEYRLFDFQYLGWGVDTYDVWAVSGDWGIFCYVYEENDRWERRSLGYNVKSTDTTWDLEGYPIDRANVPKEVVDYLESWESKD